MSKMKRNENQMTFPVLNSITMNTFKQKTKDLFMSKQQNISPVCLRCVWYRDDACAGAEFDSSITEPCFSDSGE